MYKGVITALCGIICSITLQAQTEPLFLYKVQQDEKCRQWVDSVMNGLNTREKVGQLFIYTISPVQTKANMDLLRSVVNSSKVGGLLFSKGETANQVQITNKAQEMANVPLMITFDGEWGLSMRLKNTPDFPRNMVLGCIDDDQLLYEYGKEMARQCREMGIHVNFAPVADVNINPENPVINTRSFGEDPNRVADKVIAYASGLESGGVLATPKHFPGHGDTEVDSHKGLPVLHFSRERLDSIELNPFRKVINAGVGGMMVGHLDVPALDPNTGTPASLSRLVVTDLLKNEMGFKGLVFTDALAMKGVSSNPNVCLQALKAGHDMVLCPPSLKSEIDAVVKAIDKGEITKEEIDAKCRKVLTYKYAMGLNKRPRIQLSGIENRLNTAHTRDLIKRLNMAAVTVLRNEEETLPLYPGSSGVAVLHVGNPSGTSSFTKNIEKHTRLKHFRLRKDMSPAARKKLTDSISDYRRLIVAVSDKQVAGYQAFFQNFNPDIPVVYVFFTQNKPVEQLQESVSKASVAVLAHSTNKDVLQHTADLLFARATTDGRLSASIGTVFHTGAGVDITPQTPYHFIPEELGMRSSVLNRIEDIAKEGILKGAYPGCQIVILKDGKAVYDEAFGTFAGKNSKKVDENSIYDIASLTKTSATLLAVMKLYDRGLFNLSDKMSRHLPMLYGTNKANLTIREVLFHEAGLPSSSFFYQKAIDKNSYTGKLFSNRKDATHTVRMGASTYVQPKFKFVEGLTSTVQTQEYTIQVSDSFWVAASFKDSAMQAIIDLPLREKKYRYSCVGFILLQQMVEVLSGMPMDEFLAKEFYEPMGLKRTAFKPLRYFSKDEIVPSTTDRFLRKGEVRGYVHDESAAFLGGVSGNAGLFSNAKDMARIYQMILNGGTYEGKQYLSKETCKLFTTLKSKTSHRGLGFNKPNPKEPKNNPCAVSAPNSVYGHTGFTGTCVWVDPDNKLVFVFISNRIYPDVWVNELSKLEIRERIQDTMYQAIMTSK